MSSMKQPKEGVNSKKLLSLKNTGSIFVIAGLWDCGRKVGPLQGGKQMYSYEERLRAVKLYIKYDHSLSAVIRELRYPSHRLHPKLCGNLQQGVE